MSNENEKIVNSFLFEDVAANDESLSVFDKKQKNQDGIYRPRLEDAKDKKIGYRSIIRFIQHNPTAIEKHTHYVDLKSEGLAGYYDCNKNNHPKCDLCTLYWKLAKSKNQADVEKSKLLNRETKWYSYVLVIEDEQHPELVGQILIYPFTKQIKDKINAERDGEVTGKPCNVYHLSRGKDLKLIIKQKGNNEEGKAMTNYESSQFLEVSPIKLYDEKTKTFKVAPVDDKGMISMPKVIAKIDSWFNSKTVNLDDHKPVLEWDDETRNKVEQILAIVSGDSINMAERNVSKAKTNATESVPSPIDNIEASTSDDFFSLNE